MNAQNRSAIIWGSVILGIIGLVVLLAMVGGEPSSNGNGSEGTAELVDPVSLDEHIKGNPLAPITIVEYSDFQCSFCERAYPGIKQIAEEYPDDVRIIYRHFPLRQAHPQAQIAAQATEAAALQGKFWEMHDAIFNTSDQWSNASAKNFFIQLAGSLGLDTEQFEKDITSSAVVDAVNEDLRTGARTGLTGTPTLFLNSKQMSGNSYASIKAAVDTKLDELRSKNGDEPTEPAEHDNEESEE